MLKKLVVVYDAGAASFPTIKKEIIEPARKLTGVLVGKFVWQPVGFGENARRLAQFLHDGDLVVVAGGDGLASMAANAVLLTRRDVTLAVVGYGLTHDISGLTRVKRPVLYGDEYVGGVEEILRKADEGKTLEVFPLQIKVNGKPWRYALAHASAGSLAASLQGLDEAPRKRFVGTKLRLFSWRMLHGREGRLPEATLKELPEELDGGKEDIEKVENLVEASKPVEVAKTVEDVKEVKATEQVGESKTTKPSIKSHDKSDEKVDRGADKQVLLLAGKKTMAIMAENVATEAKDEAVVPEKVVETPEAVEDKMPVVVESMVCEMMILGELCGRKLRVSRGLAGVLERIGRMRWKFYNMRHGRTVACAVEADAEVAASRAEVAKVDVGRLLGARVTDLIVVNGLTMGKKWHGGRFYKKPVGFLVKAARLGGVLSEFKMSLVSRIWRIPGSKMKGRIELKFLESQDIYVETDNAWEKITGVETIEIGKSRRSVKMVK